MGKRDDCQAPTLERLQTGVGFSWRLVSGAALPGSLQKPLQRHWLGHGMLRPLDGSVNLPCNLTLGARPCHGFLATSGSEGLKDFTG